VRQVHQDAVSHHGLNGGTAAFGEAPARRLRKHPSVDRVGKERDRGRVRRHLAVEEVRQRDVGDTVLLQLGDVALDLRG
jgi:hypothetical protein